MSSKRLIQFARELRSHGTDAERRIWSYLRHQKLGGHIFRRQHPIGPFIVDFYCHAARLVIELDGGQHTEPEVKKYDEQRTQALEAEGLYVIRFSDVDALRSSDEVAEAILRETDSRVKRPPP